MNKRKYSKHGYDIIAHQDISAVCDEVCNSLVMGWRPYGSPYGYTDENGQTFHCQAIVLLEEDETDD